MLEKWGYDWHELLYEGFEDIPRQGMVQEQFMTKEITWSEHMRPPSDLPAMPAPVRTSGHPGEL